MRTKTDSFPNMAFPKKHTRHLSVDGTRYLWHLNKDWDVRTRWIVVQRDGCVGGQLLMVDPYHHDLLPSRGTVSRAVRFAMCHGWRPECKAPPLQLRFTGATHGFQLVIPPPNKGAPANRRPVGKSNSRSASSAAVAGLER